MCYILILAGDQKAGLDGGPIPGVGGGPRAHGGGGPTPEIEAAAADLGQHLHDCPHHKNSPLLFSFIWRGAHWLLQKYFFITPHGAAGFLSHKALQKHATTASTSSFVLSLPLFPLMLTLLVSWTGTGGRRKSLRKGQRRPPRATAAPGGLEVSAGECH